MKAKAFLIFAILICFFSGKLFAIDEIQREQAAAEIQKGFDSLEAQPPHVKTMKRRKKEKEPLIDTAALEEKSQPEIAGSAAKG